jgi:hypothetical protein
MSANATMDVFIVVVLDPVVIYSNEDVLEECSQSSERTHSVAGKFLHQLVPLRNAEEQVRVLHCSQQRGCNELVRVLHFSFVMNDAGVYSS